MERPKQVLLRTHCSVRKPSPLLRHLFARSAPCRCATTAVVLPPLLLLLALTVASASRDVSGNRTTSAQTNASERRSATHSPPPGMRRPPSSPSDIFAGARPPGEPRDRMLKSSKDALIVTKKSYLKKDWCKTEPLIQRVREAGCVTRTIVNRFCYGQCNSFYIPKNARAELDATAFKSCAFCKPKRFRWITITLRCPGRQPPYKRKRIQRIKKCKCISEILQ